MLKAVSFVLVRVVGSGLHSTRGNVPWNVSSDQNRSKGKGREGEGVKER
jgi:hypothetical protein